MCRGLYYVFIYRTLPSHLSVRRADSTSRCRSEITLSNFRHVLLLSSGKTSSMSKMRNQLQRGPCLNGHLFSSAFVSFTRSRLTSFVQKCYIENVHNNEKTSFNLFVFLSSQVSVVYLDSGNLHVCWGFLPRDHLNKKPAN